MSRPKLLLILCVGLALAIVGAAGAVTHGLLASPATEAVSTPSASLPLVSFTHFAWPLVQGVLSP